MTKTIWKTPLFKASAGAAALAACALAGATVAAGAGSATTKAGTTTTATTTTRAAHTPEAALTGDALAKVTAAAIAKVGGTVDSATAENDGKSAAALYEAHVTKADGTHVTVILDKDYAVLTVETGGPGGHGHDGHGGPGGSGETALTGDVATKAIAAAVAKAGGTADRASTENDSSNTAAAYEVHVTKADGSHVTVTLDKAYAVLSVETSAGGGPSDHFGHGH